MLNLTEKNRYDNFTQKLRWFAELYFKEIYTVATNFTKIYGIHRNFCALNPFSMQVLNMTGGSIVNRAE